jgi:hypothetical protein
MQSSWRSLKIRSYFVAKLHEKAPVAICLALLSRVLVLGQSHVAVDVCVAHVADAVVSTLESSCT